MEQTKLKIINLKCEGCVDTITKGLKKQNAISSYEINLADKTLDLQYDAHKITVIKIQKIITKMGYQTEVL